MKREPDANTTTTILRLFGGALIAFGLIFALAWAFNRADAQAFAKGNRVEGTVVQIWEGDSPGVEIEFVDRNGRSETWAAEKTTEASRTGLAVGDPVVAVQMRDSPSRIMLLEDVESRPSDWNGLILGVLFLLPGIYLIVQKRPFGTEAQQQTTAIRQQYLARGNLFLFMGLIMLVGFVASLGDTSLHIIGRVLLGGFCLLTGGGMAGVGLVQLWKSFQQR